MSNFSDAIDKSLMTSIKQMENLPQALRDPKSPSSDSCWKDGFYPRFTDYRIEIFLDYLLSLQHSDRGTSYAILPVSDALSIPEILLETVMHYAGNCDGQLVFTDLSPHSQIKKLLEEAHAFDNNAVSKDANRAQPVLHDLFHYISFAQDIADGSLTAGHAVKKILNLVEPFDIQVYLLPMIRQFDVSCVQLIRQVEFVILMSPENIEDTLSKSERFVRNLGAKPEGVYYID